MKYLLSIFLTISLSACGGGDPEPDSPSIEIETKIHTVEPAPTSPVQDLELIRNYPPQKSINPIDCSLTKSCG